MSVMPHKEKHKYLQSVLCSATDHECFSFCLSDGFAIVRLMHIHVKNLKIGSCKHFEVIDTPWKSMQGYFVDRRVGSDAVGGGGGPRRSRSSTYATISFRLSSGTQSSTRYRLSFCKIFSTSFRC